MKVLVTGGAGYVGSELVYQLSQLDQVKEILVYDNLSNRNYNLFISHSNLMRNDKVKFEKGDLLDSRKLRKAMDGADVVYHLAAKVNIAEEHQDSYAFEHTNHWGTAEVVYAAEEANVKHFIYLSSTGVYGFSNSGEELTEGSRLNPRTHYAISKMRGEEHVLRLSDKLNVVVLRASSVYGYSPAIRFDSVINNFLFESHFNNHISIHGSGKQMRSFVHLNHVVKGMIRVVQGDVESGVYNLVQRNASILDLVDTFKALYPSLEFIFINQHIGLRNLQVNLNTKFDKYLTFDRKIELHDDIVKMTNRAFSF